MVWVERANYSRNWVVVLLLQNYETNFCIDSTRLLHARRRSHSVNWAAVLVSRILLFALIEVSHKIKVKLMFSMFIWNTQTQYKCNLRRFEPLEIVRFVLIPKSNQNCCLIFLKVSNFITKHKTERPFKSQVAVATPDNIAMFAEIKLLKF